MVFAILGQPVETRPHTREIPAFSLSRNVFFSGGKGIPERWKWYTGAVETYSLAVEMVCRSGGNGVPERWKNGKKIESSLIICLIPCHLILFSYFLCLFAAISFFASRRAFYRIVNAFGVT
jgi:hypothetical protein